MAIGEGYDGISVWPGRGDARGEARRGSPSWRLRVSQRCERCHPETGSAGASRPFDADRDGFVMGEGAAVLVLGELEHAGARGAKVYAELAGYGNQLDSFHMTRPDPLGAGQARAIGAALVDAVLDPTDVDYVDAHASSTGLGDAIKTRALKLALGEDNVQTIPVSGTKGGLATASEPQELSRRHSPSSQSIATWCRQRSSTTPDPACDLDCVPNKARELPSVSRSATASASAVTTPCSSCASLFMDLSCGTHRPEVG